MTWSDYIEDASWRDVVFACQTTEDDAPRRLAQHTYLYRDGADHEDMGRGPRTTKVKAVFIGKTYLSDLGDLLREIHKGESGRFVHPLLGSWIARIKAAPVHHDAAARNICTVELDIVEDGTNQVLADLVGPDVLEAEVDAAIADAQVTSTITDPTVLEKIAGAIAAAQSFVAGVRSKVAQATAMVNAVRNKIAQAIAAIRAITDISSWPIVRALKRLALSVTKLAKTIRNLKPNVVWKRLSASIPLRALAHSLYGDAKRSAEIERMNPVRNTFLVPAGTRLKVYSK